MIEGIIGLTVISLIVIGFGIWVYHEVKQPWE